MSSSDPFPPRMPRVPFERPVWVGVADVSRPLRRAWAANLSKGGMFIRMQNPFPVGTSVLVALDGVQEILPIAEATVVWARPIREDGTANLPAGVGVAFKTLKNDAGILLDTLVEAGGFETTPPRDSLRWAEPKTPVVVASPEPEAREAWAALSIPHVGTLTLRAVEGELKVEFERQNVASVEQSLQSVTIKLR